MNVNVSVSNLFIFLLSIKFVWSSSCINVCMDSAFCAVVPACDYELYFWIAFSALCAPRYKDPFLCPLLFREMGRKALTYILVSGYKRINNISAVEIIEIFLIYIVSFLSPLIGLTKVLALNFGVWNNCKPKIFSKPTFKT